MYDRIVVGTATLVALRIAVTKSDLPGLEKNGLLSAESGALLRKPFTTLVAILVALAVVRRHLLGRTSLWMENLQSATDAVCSGKDELATNVDLDGIPSFQLLLSTTVALSKPAFRRQAFPQVSSSAISGRGSQACVDRSL